MADATLWTPSTEDARALDLLKASGVLNPDLTLDKLMDVTHRLNELEPASVGDKATIHVFIHRLFCFSHQAP